jgi:hypothetical protein
MHVWAFAPVELTASPTPSARGLLRAVAVGNFQCSPYEASYDLFFFQESKNSENKGPVKAGCGPGSSGSSRVLEVDGEGGKGMFVVRD